MISVEQALKIHTIAIEKFGGANGVVRHTKTTLLL